MDRNKRRFSHVSEHDQSYEKPSHRSRANTTHRGSTVHEPGTFPNGKPDREQKEKFVESWVSKLQQRTAQRSDTLDTEHTRPWRPHKLPVAFTAHEATNKSSWRDSSIIPDPPRHQRHKACTTQGPPADGEQKVDELAQGHCPDLPAIVRTQFDKKHKRNAVKNRFERKKKRRRDQSTEPSDLPEAGPVRQTRAVTGEDLIKNFQSNHISKHRVTLPPGLVVGIFGNGRFPASNGLPDLAFAQMDFLNRPVNKAAETAALTESIQRLTKRNDQEKERPFLRRPCNSPVHRDGPEPQASPTQEQARIQTGNEERLQSASEVRTLADRYPIEPECGILASYKTRPDPFNSSPEKEQLTRRIGETSRATTYLSWSPSRRSAGSISPQSLPLETEKSVTAALQATGIFAGTGITLNQEWPATAKRTGNLDPFTSEGRSMPFRSRHGQNVSNREEIGSNTSTPTQRLKSPSQESPKAPAVGSQQTVQQTRPNCRADRAEIVDKAYWGKSRSNHAPVTLQRDNHISATAEEELPTDYTEEIDNQRRSLGDGSSPDPLLVKEETPDDCCSGKLASVPLDNVARPESKSTQVTEDWAYSDQRNSHMRMSALHPRGQPFQSGLSGRESALSSKCLSPFFWAGSSSTQTSQSPGLVTDIYSAQMQSSDPIYPSNHDLLDGREAAKAAIERLERAISRPSSKFVPSSCSPQAEVVADGSLLSSNFHRNRKPRYGGKAATGGVQDTDAILLRSVKNAPVFTEPQIAHNALAYPDGQDLDMRSFWRPNVT